MNTDLDKVKKIRETTSLSVGEIAKALKEAGNDEKTALGILKARGVKIAEKKAARAIKAGVVASYIHLNGRIGAMLELGTETDFVARHEAFLSLAHDLAMQIASMDPPGLEELLAQPFIKDPQITVGDLINQCMAKMGENIKVGRFVRFEI